MLKNQRQYSFNFGRVFFPNDEKNQIPEKILFQPLGNHVGNTVRLAKKWKKEGFSDKSEKRVVEAAKIHDMGKPQKFEIRGETKAGKFQKYIYSFRGHRFLAQSNDKWAEKLAIGHHDFSVHDICTATYELKKDEKYKDILTNEPLAYARELYILEMCDQIEAELACRIFEDEKQAESRTFMDFTIEKSSETTYFIDPWVFESIEPIELTFKSWVMQPSEDDKSQLDKCIKDNREEALGKTCDRIVKTWWQDKEGKPEESIIKTIELKPYPSRMENKNWNAQDFYCELGGFTPNPMQVEMFDAIYSQDLDKHPAILLKSSTGSGKFESVVFPALASNYRLILPLPARSLLEDQKQRIEKYLKEFSRLYRDREVSLVEDTGSKMYRWVYKKGEEIKPRTKNVRRHLYKGDIILTTIDKFLYRYFAFGDKQKSFTFPLRINQEKTLICFDEAHSYDEISFTNFHSLVKSLYEAGRSIVLMTATMPEEYLQRLDYLEIIDYIDNPEKYQSLNQFQQATLKQEYPNQKSFEWINNIERDSENPESFQNYFSQLVLAKWKKKPNCKLIVVVERVGDAVEIYRQVKSYLGANTDELGRFLFLYHGRIADQIRPRIYQELQKRDTDNLPYILITTRAIEVGCDLNSEILITEICPPENLIQRAGRCNRKGNIDNAEVIVIGNSIPEFANSLDELGWQNYQETLQSLKEFDTQKIAECISVSQQVDDYRVVELFSMLHDYVYNADLTCKHAHEKGLIITRSWTPSASLIYKEGSKESHTITVPLDRLIKHEENDFSNTYIYEICYNPETTRWDLQRDLGWGCAYSKDIVVEIHKNIDGACIYDGKQEYDYDEELGFVKLPGIFIKLKSHDFDEKLLCKQSDKKSAIITYTKSVKNETD
ncbi:CRISPR-associated helicase Cas3' [Calothrix sp. UHCC 0171]|uniref:CRISPR-associated helicase Cas3' n=1 Tax=Calothrix sp. UHCC 0171 TaxID=3110245 RepID=UPI002B204712|nr:CRISPR-associated helicase Cas3' [Calothrix sp. UHCC 0171]MEA5571982.1 CRISPR-associated helicase Cas3' [Calothrix sp. UHCC 0171]